jgi:hypothetical protein
VRGDDDKRLGVWESLEKNTDKSGIRRRRSEMHQTSEPWRVTIPLASPLSLKSSLRSPLLSRCTPLSCSTWSSEQCQALRRLLEIGGIAKGGLSTPSRVEY